MFQVFYDFISGVVYGKVKKKKHFITFHTKKTISMSDETLG
jgi:hypothetical protein